MNEPLARALGRCPLVAILRGIDPSEADDVGRILIDSGFTVLEVPLNSPRPLASIESIARLAGADVVVGGGTVLSPEEVSAIKNAGGDLIVAPNSDVAVVTAAKTSGLACIPGVMTPSEAFAMLRAGADALKLFPADLLGPGFLKALRAVVPADASILPVGGIGPGSLPQWRDAGAAGAGIGTALYSPGVEMREIARRARNFVQEWGTVCGRQ